MLSSFIKSIIKSPIIYSGIKYPNSCYIPLNTNYMELIGGINTVCNHCDYRVSCGVSPLSEASLFQDQLVIKDKTNIVSFNVQNYATHFKATLFLKTPVIQPDNKVFIKLSGWDFLERKQLIDLAYLLSIKLKDHKCLGETSLIIVNKVYPLTKREFEIIYLIQLGYSAKVIARYLGINFTTVNDVVYKTKIKLCFSGNKKDFSKFLFDRYKLSFYIPETFILNHVNFTKLLLS